MDWITKHRIAHALQELGVAKLLTVTPVGYDMTLVTPLGFVPDGSATAVYLPPMRLATALATARALIDDPGPDAAERVWWILVAAAGSDAHHAGRACVCHGCWSERVRSLGCAGAA